jgi:acyl-CoA synthetase (AMP-forming)/AMP-acid ligase II
MLNDLQVYKGSREINERKFLRNVLKEGDCYYNVGDIFSMDDEYFLYFKDRFGDTFRSVIFLVGQYFLIETRK